MSTYTKHKRMGTSYGRSEEERAFLLNPAYPTDDSGMSLRSEFLMKIHN